MFPLYPALAPLLLVLASRVLSSCAVPISVDDVDPSWNYTGAWGAISAADPCTACVTQPDPSRTFDHTWHDLSSAGSAQITFTGVSFALYTVCPGPHTGGFYRGNFSFTLDGIPDGQFLEPSPAGCSVYEYNYVVFNATGLAYGQHTFEIYNHENDTSSFATSDLVLDYAIYDDGTQATSTTSTSAPSSSVSAVAAEQSIASAPSSSSSIPVAAVAVPLVVMISILAVAIFLALRRRRRNAQDAEHIVSGQDIQPRPFVNERAPGRIRVPLGWTAPNTTDSAVSPDEPQRPPLTLFVPRNSAYPSAAYLTVRDEKERQRWASDTAFTTFGTSVAAMPPSYGDSISQ